MRQTLGIVLLLALAGAPAPADDLLGRGSSQSGAPGGSARPEWRDPRSLLDESRPPGNSASAREQEQYRSRDLPAYDRLRREMDRPPRTAAEIIEEFNDYYLPYRTLE